MPRRTKSQHALVKGLWNADCDRCGFEFKSCDLKKEWTGFMVCFDCYEPRHPQDYVRSVPDDSSVPWTRPGVVPDSTESNGDVSKTLIVDTNTNIQTWNTELTEDRVVILATDNVQKGDRFIIYKTVDDDNKLIFVTTLKFSGTTV